MLTKRQTGLHNCRTMYSFEYLLQAALTVRNGENIFFFFLLTGWFNWFWIYDDKRFSLVLSCLCPWSSALSTSQLACLYSLEITPQCKQHVTYLPLFCWVLGTFLEVVLLLGGKSSSLGMIRLFQFFSPDVMPHLREFYVPVNHPSHLTHYKL